MINHCQSYRKKKKINKIKMIAAQILILVLFTLAWELSATSGLVDEFLISKPSNIIKLLYQYTASKEIFNHIYISLLETCLGIVIGTLLGIIAATILWYSETLTKVLNPFLVVLNALPKTALAPIMIIWAGTGVSGIVVVAISILIIVTILSSYNYFISVDKDQIKMMKSFKATKTQIFTKLIFPSNLVNIISIVRINIGLAWVGVIVGEFLVSRNGIGYLIMYGGQVFKLDLVMMGVIVLAIIALLMNLIVTIIEKILFKKRGR